MADTKTLRLRRGLADSEPTPACSWTIVITGCDTEAGLPTQPQTYDAILAPRVVLRMTAGAAASAP
jgi:hypothetical protein